MQKLAFMSHNLCKVGNTAIYGFIGRIIGLFISEIFLLRRRALAAGTWRLSFSFIRFIYSLYTSNSVYRPTTRDQLSRLRSLLHHHTPKLSPDIKSYTRKAVNVLHNSQEFKDAWTMAMTIPSEENTR
jgi:hypothetical protein